MNIDINGATPFYHVPECPNRNVEDLALRCIAAQRDAVSVNHRPPGSLDAAKAAVAPEALERILSDGDDIHGIAEDEGLSDVILFNAAHLDGICGCSVSILRSRSGTLFTLKPTG
jgi:hypothetical protein